MGIHMAIGKRVLFYSSIKDKGLFNIQQFYQVDIHILKNLGYTVILSNRIADAWKFWQYDLVFAYFYRYSLFVSFIAKIFGRSTFFTGGIDALDSNLVSKIDHLIQKWLFKMCYLLSKRCIIVSRTDMNNVSTIVRGRKLAYSEHTINTDAFDCDISAKQNLITTIVWQDKVSNVKRKGVDNALRLFARLHQLPEYSEYKFVIIGKTGEGTTYLKDIVSELGIDDSVVFTGSISETEKVNYLKCSKIYFQLSLFEGFGVAALEALCAKNIVVHSGRGGLSNPIYKDGVLINIGRSVEEMSVQLYAGLKAISYSNLEHAHTNVCINYSNKRREEEFANILSSR